MSLFDTTYFEESLVRDGVGGCCHDFALALHRRTGWPLVVVWKQPVIDAFTICHKPSLLHVALRAPDGRAVDIEGAHDVDAMVASYAAASRCEATWDAYPDVDAYVAALDGAAFGDMMLPRERGIEAAERVIAAAPRFLALVAELSAEATAEPAARARA
jgi:hypothetical protein